MNTLKSIAEFNAALDVPKLLLFFDVDWAIQAIQSRSVLASLEQAFEAEHQSSKVEIRRLDCTDQGGPLWDATLQWIERQKVSELLAWGGYGSVAWIQSGSIVDHAHSLAAIGLKELIRRTERFLKPPSA
jgi:hypothetical protein